MQQQTPLQMNAGAMEDTLKALLDVLDGPHSLTEMERHQLASIWQPYEAPRKTLITTQGAIEGHLYFVTQGLQRVCHYGEDGKESTLVFTYAPSFGGIIDSFFLQAPSRYTYETLTSSTFMRARFSDVNALMQQHPGIVRIMHAGMVVALSGVMERMVEMQSFSSEEKFRKLMQRSPHILQLVPHKYLANYIGIDPTNFSKLMNSVKL